MGMDFTFENIIIAYTAGELMEQLRTVDDDIIIKPEEGLWVGTYRYTCSVDTFVDAFDHTVYQHEIYEPAGEEGELCLGIYKNYGKEIPNHQLVKTAGELKAVLDQGVPAELKTVSVDDNFELGGAITEKVKMFVIRRAEGVTLEFK